MLNGPDYNNRYQTYRATGYIITIPYIWVLISCNEIEFHLISSVSSSCLNGLKLSWQEMKEFSTEEGKLGFQTSSHCCEDLTLWILEHLDYKSMLLQIGDVFFATGKAILDRIKE